MLLILLSLSASAFLTISQVAAAQQANTVEVRASNCLSCRIEVAEFARVGDVTGAGMVNDQGRLFFDERGQIFLGGPKQGSVVKVFSPDGKFIRTIGRPGRGPGEFMSPYTVAFTANGITHVFDAIPQRWIVFDSGFRHVGTTIIPFTPVGVVMLNEDVAIITGESHGKETIGYPLHMVSRSRGLVRSFGSERALLDPRRPRDMVRVIAAATGANLWSARVNSYEIELFDTLGVRRSRFTRNVSWFKPWTTQVATALEFRPNPAITDMQQDENGYIWLLIQVADADWRPREGIPRPGGMTYVPDTMHDLIYDTIIEVIDPRSARLVASQRFQQQFRRFAGDGIVYKYAEDRSDNPFYSAYRLTLTGLDK